MDSIEHGALIDKEAARLMKEKKVCLVPTVYRLDWVLENAERSGASLADLERLRQVRALTHERVGKAIAFGVPIAFGTDANVYPHGLNGREFAVLVRLGMTPLEAIRAATLRAASLLGWSDRVGTLEPGRLADMIAVAGNPLEDITLLERVQFVMKGGAVYRNDFGAGER